MTFQERDLDAYTGIVEHCLYLDMATGLLVAGDGATHNPTRTLPHGA